jgi:enoyl-[acyl-carrier protein] reductase II
VPYSFEDNRVVRDLGVEFPIFHGPITMLARSAMAGGVAAAGGVGLLESASLDVAGLQVEYDAVRAMTDRPFGINFAMKMLDLRGPDLEADLLDWVLDGRVPFVTTGYGDPLRLMPRIQDAGVIHYHVTDDLDEALRVQDAGANGIVLGGAEKGGGSRINGLHTFVMLQKARRQIDIPLCATGGIADGRGMAGVFALGAEGILMGTRFWASKECPAHVNTKQGLVEAEATVYIGNSMMDGTHTMQAVRNEFAEAVLRGEDPYDEAIARRGEQPGLKVDAYKGDAIRMYFSGEMDMSLLGCGEGAVLMEEIKSCHDIVHDTVNEFWTEIERLAALLPTPAGASV